METFFRTPYNYAQVRESSPCCPRVFMDRVVRIADTDIKQDSASFSNLEGTSDKSYYTNSEVPIKVYGNGILSTHFDPTRQNVHDMSTKVPDSVASRSVDNSVAVAGAAASSASVVANSQTE